MGKGFVFSSAQRLPEESCGILTDRPRELLQRPPEEIRQARGDVQALRHLTGVGVSASDSESLLDAAFLKWLLDRYGSLYNQPPTPPVMVHHVPKAMAASSNDGGNGRIALLVIDGMSVGQWAVIREVMREHADDLRFEEAARLRAQRAQDDGANR